MRYSFIYRTENSRKLIILFAGWAMDESVFSGLEKPGFDIVVMFDYYDESNDIAAFYSQLSNSYDETTTIAWSFGVAVANNLLTGKESAAIAVNGTPSAVDDKLGIPRHVFAITLRMLNQSNLQKFYDSVFVDRIPKALPNRDIENLRKELELMGKYSGKTVSPYWTKCFVSSSDRIIPPKNQLEAWSNNDVTILEKQPHFPDFQAILDNYIIDKNLIGRRFTENVDGYETDAIVQKRVANKLYHMWMTYQNPSDKKILEIGIGTGFLTRLYVNAHISPLSMAVDLADSATLKKTLKAYGIDYPGKIITADAERFVRECEPESFDTIVSSSTIQWFCRLEDFFNNIKTILKPGGLGVFSTFENGTFQEIKKITGRALNYPTVEKIETILPPELEVLETFSEEHVMEFENGIQLMRHIKSTGVNSLGHPMPYGETLHLLKSLDKLPRLTYRPIYFILKKLS